MRYSEGHKQQTRAKVLKAAARAVRAKGPDGVAVAEIMAEAGLTHGGFYAHFPSKEALVAAAIETAFGESSERFLAPEGPLGPDGDLARFVDVYVSATHRDRPERGCPVVTLSSDLPRQGETARAAYDAGVRRLIDAIACRLPAGAPAERVALAGSLLAEMAGAVALARAVADPEFSDRLLAETRASVKRRIGPAASSPDTGAMS